MTGCDVGISYFLPRAVGASNAAELMMTGRFIDAENALRIGLVSAVVDDNLVAQTARELADDMLAMSPFGLRLTKEGLNMAQDAGSLEAVIALEDRGQMLCRRCAGRGWARYFPGRLDREARCRKRSSMA